MDQADVVSMLTSLPEGSVLVRFIPRDAGDGTGVLETDSILVGSPNFQSGYFSHRVVSMLMAMLPDIMELCGGDKADFVALTGDESPEDLKALRAKILARMNARLQIVDTEG